MLEKHVEYLNDQQIIKLGFVLKRTSKGIITNFAHIVKHSPTGLEWGYGGSGPADTAYSILYHTARLTKMDINIESLYQTFKWEVIANLSRECDTHIIPLTDVIEFVKKYQNPRKED